MARRKKRSKKSSPRKAPLGRKDRLREARQWLRTFAGTRVIQAYRRRFRVTLACALNDLERLGVALDPDYVAARRARPRGHRSKARSIPVDNGYGKDWDDHHAFIAGHTSAGFAYGTTWEDAIARGLLEDPPCGPDGPRWRTDMPRRETEPRGWSETVWLHEDVPSGDDPPSGANALPWYSDDDLPF